MVVTATIAWSLQPRRQLDRAPQLSFHSGMQNGLICGNPGDRILTAGFEKGDLRNDALAPLPQYTHGGCTIQAVYPASSQARTNRRRRGR